MENKDTDTTIAYLAYRQWRSGVFFNISVLIIGAMLAKIATNFVSGEPGFAGFRVVPLNKYVLIVSGMERSNIVAIYRSSTKTSK